MTPTSVRALAAMGAPGLFPEFMKSSMFPGGTSYGKPVVSEINGFAAAEWIWHGGGVFGW